VVFLTIFEYQTCIFVDILFFQLFDRFSDFSFFEAKYCGQSLGSNTKSTAFLDIF